MTLQYAKQRIVKDISVEDKRVQVTGYIKTQIDENNILLNDKTGEIKINIGSLEDFIFKEGDLINIIGDVEIKITGEKLINANIVQDMNKLNFDYYMKLYQIKNELDLD
jgi:uncharacterized protein YdeI (BOF family)